MKTKNIGLIILTIVSSLCVFTPITVNHINTKNEFENNECQMILENFEEIFYSKIICPTSTRYYLLKHSDIDNYLNHDIFPIIDYSDTIQYNPINRENNLWFL